MIGYAVPVAPQLASYRLRVDIPRKHLGRASRIGIGSPTFFFKQGNLELAGRLDCPIVYDVVNDHFAGEQGPDYRAMCYLADAVTCASEAMRETIHRHTGKWARVIADPYENAECPPAVKGEQVVWFGHQANFASLQPYADIDPYVLTGHEWSREREDWAIRIAAVVMLTGGNPGASANRPAKAIRGGRFVVAPEDCPESWKDLSPYMWVGDVREGIDWALTNREEACCKIRAGQEYVSRTFSPQLIGLQWADLFDSISELDSSMKRDG